MLASDLERKAGLQNDKRLAQDTYAPEQRKAVYRGMLKRAEVILKGGHSALLDATFVDPSLRAQVAEVARHAGVDFRGFWLEAPAEILENRIRSRCKDPSDAGIDVLERQLATPLRKLDWHILDASGDPKSVHRAALDALVRL
jgi:predicted kinase